MSIGARIKEERERLAYNQTDFAAMVGATKQSQINWEKGLSSPNADALHIWSQVGLDVLYVVTGINGTSRMAPDEATLLDNYRHASKKGQDVLKETSIAFAQQAVLGKRLTG